MKLIKPILEKWDDLTETEKMWVIAVSVIIIVGIIVLIQGHYLGIQIRGKLSENY